MNLTLQLDDATVARLEAEARARGLPDASARVMELIRAGEAETPEERAQRVIDQMQKVPTNGMTGDEMIDLFRSEA